MGRCRPKNQNVVVTVGQSDRPMSVTYLSYCWRFASRFINLSRCPGSPMAAGSSSSKATCKTAPWFSPEWMAPPLEKGALFAAFGSRWTVACAKPLSPQLTAARPGSPSSPLCSARTTRSSSGRHELCHSQVCELEGHDPLLVDARLDTSSSMAGLRSPKYASEKGVMESKRTILSRLTTISARL